MSRKGRDLGFTLMHDGFSESIRSNVFLSCAAWSTLLGPRFTMIYTSAAIPLSDPTLANGA